jgi:hypothetical protein
MLRQCQVLESLIYATVTSHDVRRLPESRNDLVRQVYLPTHREDVLRRIAPPPLPNAAAGETILDESDVVRLVRADVLRREQSWHPSKRSNLITESMVRLHWAPQDTALAWRISRARVAADAVRERRMRRHMSTTPVSALLQME